MTLTKNRIIVTCYAWVAIAMLSETYAQQPLPELHSVTDFEEYVWGIHEVELKDDVPNAKFEDFVKTKFAPSWAEFRNGLRIVVLKSDRGERAKKFAISFVSESLKDRELLFPNKRPSALYRKAISESRAEWQELLGYLKKGPGSVPYQSYSVVQADAPADAVSKVNDRGPTKQLTEFPQTAEEHARTILAVNDSNSDGKLVQSEFRSRVLANAFDDFDADGDAELDFSELTEMSKKFRWSKSLTAPIAVEVESHDTNENGKLERQEVAATRFEASFAEIDTDKDGSLSKFEIAVFTVKSQQRSRFGGGLRGNQLPGFQELRAISRVTTDADVQRLLAQDDTNKDGKLGDGDEVIRPNLKRNFARFDTNADGFLDATELKKTGLRPFGGAVFLEAFDKDRNGLLNKEEATHPMLANDFEKLDSNQDGKLSGTEMDVVRGGMLFGSKRGRGLFQSLINRFDPNGDGKISKEESANTPILGKNFEQLDADNNGLLNSEEISRLGEILRRSRISFASSDKDGNGKLSKAELPDQLAEIEFEKADTDGDGELSEKELQTARRSLFATRFFKNRDKNENGRLEKEELGVRMQSSFENIDADSDGSLTITEFEKSFPLRRGLAAGSTRQAPLRFATHRQKSRWPIISHRSRPADPESQF